MHTLRHLRFAIIARLIAVAAVLCLLGVQQVATFHGLSHLSDDSSTGSQKHLPHSKSCDKCLVYAEVSGAGPTSVHSALQVPPQIVVIAFTALALVSSRTLPVYSARAPPLSR
ncbi:MAG: hypothetical protein ABI790_10120 [Betaproteobacteria bacterium]